MNGSCTRLGIDDPCVSQDPLLRPAGQPQICGRSLGLSDLHHPRGTDLGVASPWLLHPHATRCCPSRRLWRNLQPRQTSSPSPPSEGISSFNARSTCSPAVRGVIASLSSRNPSSVRVRRDSKCR